MRHLILCLPLLATLGIPAALSPAHAECRWMDDPFPASTTGRCAREFFSTINNPTSDAVRAFEGRWASGQRLQKTPIEARASRLGEMRKELGTITVTRIDTAGLLTVFATASATGEELAFQFEMSSTEANKLDAVQISPASEVSTSAISPSLRASTVEGVAKALRSGYVFPEVGDKMADSILAKLKAGEYDAVASEAVLAKRLTDDCRAISQDKHLGIRPTPAAPASASAPSQGLQDDPRRDNYGFRKVELLPGNIGYLRFDMFFEGKEAYEVATSAMTFLSGADAIIFDLRGNGGGSPAMIRHITSYLFESRTHLNDMVDREGKTVSEYWTADKVEGRRPRAGIPIYVLTSGRTFSGAEEFSYNLQNLERATIVGETTGGGAHPVRTARLNDRFMVRIPYMRARNPITKTNWEGSGVEPDVKTTADAALDKALELARAAKKP